MESDLDPAADSGPLPTGRWTHSYEEDVGDVQVYRRSETFLFPPSRRGRETLAFGEGGQLTNSTPGPDDRARHSSGSVTALGRNRFRLRTGESAGSDIEVVEVAPDALRIRRL